MCPPDARPGGLSISPVSSSPTAVPTIRSCRWMWGTARATADGPITHRTMVTTPNSRTNVRENSRALCQMRVRGETGFSALRARPGGSGCPALRTVAGRLAIREPGEEVLVDGLDDRRALADGRGDPLHRHGPDVAGGEHSVHGRLVGQARAGGRRPGRRRYAGQHESLLVA